MAGTRLTSISFVLQGPVKADDDRWSYTNSEIPSDTSLNSADLIKSVAIVSNSTKQNIMLRFVKPSPNRAIANDPLDHFLSISFADFRLRQATNVLSTSQIIEPTSTPATAKESADYITRLLKTGLTINGVTYNFYGHSNSQLKSRTCFLMAAGKQEISNKVNSLGDFSRIGSVGKLAKRIALMFSAAEVACEIRPELCEDIPDVETKDYNFTDGCGPLSSNCAKILVRKIDIQFRNTRYIPSVFQIRYRGYKGVLTIDPAMKGPHRSNSGTR